MKILRHSLNFGNGALCSRFIHGLGQAANILLLRAYWNDEAFTTIVTFKSMPFGWHCQGSSTGWALHDLWPAIIPVQDDYAPFLVGEVARAIIVAACMIWSMPGSTLASSGPEAGTGTS